MAAKFENYSWQYSAFCFSDVPFWGESLLCFYNDSFRPSLGAEGKHPAIGKKGKEVWSDIWEFIGPLIKGVMTDKKPVWFEDQLVPFFRNGQTEEIYWTFSHSPAFGDNGEVAGVLVTCMETTATVLARKRIAVEVANRTEEIKHAHASLLEANIYLQQIINLFKEPLQVLQPVIESDEIVDFRFKLTNATYISYANATPDQLHNKKVSDVFPGYFQTSSFTKVAETFKTGTADTWELHYNQDGLDLYNQMSATKLGNEVVVHFTDFTKLKHLQLELLQKIEELERSNRQLEEFAYAASHDMKEPIRKIMVFNGQLKDHLESRLKENEVQIFERIENSTKRMMILVDDLLNYSHVSTQPIEKEEVDLNEKIRRVLGDLELTIHQKQAVIRVGNLPVINGYRRQLQQLFQNLVSNALKYSKPDLPPVIQIEASTSDENGQAYHLIEVKDNGIGFAQEHAEKIFQMFTRLHGKHEYSGTGIGLSIVKKVVENHGGFIQAESSTGGGAAFRVYLPL